MIVRSMRGTTSIPYDAHRTLDELAFMVRLDLVGQPHVLVLGVTVHTVDVTQYGDRAESLCPVPPMTVEWYATWRADSESKEATR